MNTMTLDKAREGFDLPDIELGFSGKRANTKIVVAMSGGVDSSVVAGLLHNSGYDVVGITLQLYDHGANAPQKGACCAGADIRDARQAAAQLGFPHYVLDYESRFREQVINPFMNSYIEGETPVPCIACNQTVKFSDLLATARELGAHALATGHYVETKRRDDGHYSLYRGAETERDQSYFLFATDQAQLDYLRFPLGGMAKADVRSMANVMGLRLAEKPDSQDICFVTQGRYADIIRKLKPEAIKPGAIVTLDGQKIGEHKGLIDFTVGQRRGLGVAVGEPLFVIRLDRERNEVIVGPREALATTTIALRDLNWLGSVSIDDFIKHKTTLWARVRSTRPPVPGSLSMNDKGQLLVELDIHEAGVSPGQACVFYESDDARARVLGGGWIIG